MKRGTIYALLILTVITITYQSCKKKENELKTNANVMLANFFNKSGNSNLYTYNSTYNVLMFDSFEDLEALDNELDAIEDNFPYNRGKEEEIIQTLNNIKTYGWTSKKTSSKNEVLIKPFKKLLSQSHPLSDEVLQFILEIHDQVTPSFSTELVVPIFEENLPYSLDVLGSILDSQISSADKDNLENKDDQTVLVPSYTFDDFLKNIPGYRSLYASLEHSEKLQLEGGMDPINPFFDLHTVKNDIERLVLNIDNEVYIDGNLIKIFDSCRVAIFHNNITQAYADLSLLTPEGNVVPPVLAESSEGLALSLMNQYVPLNFALFPITDIPLVRDEESNELEINFEAIIAADFVSNCPIPAFTKLQDTTDAFSFYFNSFTDLNYNGGTFYQHWDFGDGTGSFFADPHHTYASDGIYNVVLTTFNSECGCWNTSSMVVFAGTISNKAFACGIGVSATSTPVNGSTNNFEFLVLTSNYASANVIPTSLIIDYGDGNTDVLSTSLTSQTVTHEYFNSGSYNVTVSIETSDGCSSQNEPLVTAASIAPEPECCDRADKFKDRTVSIFGGDARLKIKDVVQGNYFILGGTKIVGKHAYYEKRKYWNGFRKRKADHQIVIFGTINVLDGPDGTCGTERGVIYDVDNNVYYNSGNWTETNKKRIKYKIDYAVKFGLSSKDQVRISHQVTSGLGGPKVVYYTFGDCN